MGACLFLLAVHAFKRISKNAAQLLLMVLLHVEHKRDERALVLDRELVDARQLLALLRFLLLLQPLLRELEAHAFRLRLVVVEHKALLLELVLRVL